MGEQLAALRQEIDRLDDSLTQLLAERQQLVRRVAAAKTKLGQPVSDPTREAEVLARVSGRAREQQLDPELVVAVMKTVMAAARALQGEIMAKADPARAPSPRTVVIIGGCGRMGLWLATFLAERGHSVRLVDPVPPPPGAAAFSHAPEIGPALAAVDVIAFATPIEVTSTLMAKLPPAVRPSLVFDICSVKTPVLGALGELQRKGYRATSLHPMFGPDIITLEDRTLLVLDVADSTAADEAEALFAGSPLRRLRMPVTEHDLAMAWILSWSHLANLVFGTALARAPFTAEELLAIGSTTFNGQLGWVERVCQEEPSLYYAIQAKNPEVPRLIDTVRLTLEEYRAAVVDEKPEQFADLMLATRSFLSQAQERRP